jgi:hypothetical protein
MGPLAAGREWAKEEHRDDGARLEAGADGCLPGASRVAGLGAYWGIRRVWRSSVNVEGIGDHLRERLTPPPLVPLREENAFYRDGKVCARVEGEVVIDEAGGKVRFQRVTSPTWIPSKMPPPLCFGTTA